MIIEEEEEEQKTNDHLEAIARYSAFGRAAAVCCQLRANRMQQNADRTPNVSRGIIEGREVVMTREYNC